MNNPKITPSHPMRSSARSIAVASIAIVFVAVLAGALTIPFQFESPSMFYKFGWDKTLLRSGKLVGMTAAVLLILQLPLAGRLKWLDRIFSLPTLYTWHRYNSYGIIFLLIIHPIAVFAPDGILMIPMEIRYWPEWVGAALFVTIACQFGLSQWRRNIFQSYSKWLWFHRISGIAIVAMLIVHVLYVSETFEHDGFPRTLVMVVGVGFIVLWVWVRIQSSPFSKKAMKVAKISPAGEDAFAFNFEPLKQMSFQYLPGQFSFLSFHSKHLSREPHPFTLSSSPSRDDKVECTIRCCGDWTHGVNSIETGDRVYLQGPFGRFSHLIHAAPHGEMIMIAGGIGITPMLSMLRYMLDVDDTRRALLIWSNKTHKHAFCLKELNAMEKKLTDFAWIPIFTRVEGDVGHFGRLDKNKLETLLETYSRDAAIFLCGPPPMIKQVHQDLVEIGFPKKTIHFESFGL